MHPIVAPRRRSLSSPVIDGRRGGRSEVAAKSGAYLPAIALSATERTLGTCQRIRAMLKIQHFGKVMAAYSLPVDTDFEQYLDCPTRSFLTRMNLNKVSPQSGATILSRELLESQLLASLAEIGDSETSVARAEFRNGPMLRTGSHAELIWDPHIFLDHLAAYIGVAAAGRQTIFRYTCSTITLEAARHSGPGWVPCNGGRKLKLFKIPRRLMSKTSLVACTADQFDEAAIRKLDPCGQLPAASDVTRAADWINMANASIMQRLCSTSGPITITQFDDLFTSRLVALHLADLRSPLGQILFHELTHEAIIREFRILLHCPEGVLLPAKALDFWGIREGRIRQLIRSGEWLVDAAHPDYRIRWTEESIGEALFAGSILPGLFITFLVLGILPRVQTLGGPRQFGYVPLFQLVLIRALAAVGTFEALRHELQQGVLNGIEQRLIRSEFEVDRLLSAPSHRAAADFKAICDSIGQGKLSIVSDQLFTLERSAIWTRYYNRTFN